MRISECFGNKVTSEEKSRFEDFIKKNPVASIGYLEKFGYPTNQIAEVVGINKNKIEELKSKDPETSNVPPDLWRYASQKSGFPEVSCVIKALRREK